VWESFFLFAFFRTKHRRGKVVPRLGCLYQILILRLLAEHSPRYVETLYRKICSEKRLNPDANNCKRAVRAALSKLIREGLVYRKREKGTWKWVYGLTGEGHKFVADLFIERPAR
jgi:DNA-binding transcriptional ArsR family regulator